MEPTVVDPALPVIVPLKSLAELLAWQPGRDPHNIANTPLHPRPTISSKGQANKGDGPDKCRTIVCHDMAGGYQEDNVAQGNDFHTIYNIQYWSYIDTFIYFSHHRVSIPPPGWTNAAHRNGVKCLGTIITEWAQDLVETDEMVTGPQVDRSPNPGPQDRRFFSRVYADKLVDLAVYYKFDGYLLNVESHLRGGQLQSSQTVAFLAYLKAQLHKRIPGSELIWYDSVIWSTGQVKWQNKLNMENYFFFQQSDGIFTNYTWRETHVADSVALAGTRNREVYTGIDIWGRNTFGGGGFDTHKALQVIQRDRSSVALFAPAWTYESLGKEPFMTNDRLFWSGNTGAGIHSETLEQNGPPAPPIVSVAEYILSKPSGTSSWFYTDFNRGFGRGYWIDGRRVSANSWSNLSQQSLPPCMRKEVLEQIGSSRQKCSNVRWILSPDEAYQGGTSIVLEEFGPRDKMPGRRYVYVPLYDVGIPLTKARDSTIIIVYRSRQKNVVLGAYLTIQSLALVTGEEEESESNCLRVDVPHSNPKAALIKEHDFGWQELCIDLKSQELTSSTYSALLTGAWAITEFGVSLRFESKAPVQSRTSLVDHPLVVLGSMSILPNTAVARGMPANVVQGLRAENTRHEWGVAKKDRDLLALKVWSTLRWEIGHGVNEQLAEAGVAAIQGDEDDRGTLLLTDEIQCYHVYMCRQRFHDEQDKDKSNKGHLEKQATSEKQSTLGATTTITKVVPVEETIYLGTAHCLEFTLAGVEVPLGPDFEEFGVDMIGDLNEATLDFAANFAVQIAVQAVSRSGKTVEVGQWTRCTLS